MYRDSWADVYNVIGKSQIKVVWGTENWAFYPIQPSDPMVEFDYYCVTGSRRFWHVVYEKFIGSMYFVFFMFC